MSTILVTGGAGFIGANAVFRWASRGERVVVLDNLSRRGTDLNLEWLRESVRFEFVKADIRDREVVDRTIADTRPDAVVHLAAQVAVTTSITDPRHDFEVNALGTFNVLDAVRREAPDALFLYAATNKVYGRMEDLGVVEKDGQYALKELQDGVGESRSLDFHSPYGCSKGAADQYVLDFHKTYGMRTVSFRQSCIYGPRQFGVEDQGWVAWFLIAAALGLPITIYGDGKQVRDVLHVDDLVDLYDAAMAHLDGVAGRSFNVGGGPANAISLNRLLDWMGSELGRRPAKATAPWRTGDQPVFVSDNRSVRAAIGWMPRVGWEAGIRGLAAWIDSHRSEVAAVHAAIAKQG